MKFKKFLTVLTTVLALGMTSVHAQAHSQNREHIENYGKWDVVYDIQYQECMVVSDQGSDWEYALMYDEYYQVLTFRVIPKFDVFVMGNTEMQMVFHNSKFAINQMVDIDLSHAVLPLNDIMVHNFINNSKSIYFSSLHTGEHMFDGTNIPHALDAMINIEGC